jgi:trigger factor
VSDEDVEGPIEAERRRNGELTDVDRPAARGDYITIDLAATREGEPVPGLNTEDWLYEVGRGWIAEDFDDHVIGATTGDELTFTSTPSGTEEPADFTVTVKKVQELVLPELTDEWVADTVGEPDTVEAWRSSIRERLGEVKLGQARQLLVERSMSALAGLVDEELPQALVDTEFRSRAERFIMELQGRGIGLEQWLAATGQDQEGLTESLRSTAVEGVKMDLALRAVAEAEDIPVDEDDVEDELNRIALRLNQKPNRVRREYERQDLLPELRADIRKRKALEWLLHHVEIVDPEGRPIDRALLLPDEEITEAAAEAAPAELPGADDESEA